MEGVIERGSGISVEGGFEGDVEGDVEGGMAFGFVTGS